MYPNERKNKERINQGKFETTNEEVGSELKLLFIVSSYQFLSAQKKKRKKERKIKFTLERTISLAKSSRACKFNPRIATKSF